LSSGSKTSPFWRSFLVFIFTTRAAFAAHRSNLSLSPFRHCGFGFLALVDAEL
jgi:hypothetical protein